MAHNARWQNLGILVLCALSYPAMTTAQQSALNLMPLPASVQPGTGSLRVDSTFSLVFTGYTEPRLETVFMLPGLSYSYLSSKLVREIAKLGASLKGLVPEVVEQRLRAKVS